MSVMSQREIGSSVRPAGIRQMLLLPIAGLVLVAAAVAMAQDPGQLPESLPNEKLVSTLETRGSLTLRDATLTEALFALRQQWKIDMVVSDNVEGNVNATFSDSSLREILDSLLLSRGYGYRVVGRSIVVLPLDQLGALRPLFQTETIRLRHADPDELISVVELLLSPQGKALSLSSAKSLMVLDYPDRTRMIRQQIEELDLQAKPDEPPGPQLVEEPAPLTQQTRPIAQPPAVEINRDPVGNATSDRGQERESEREVSDRAPEEEPLVELDVRVFRPQYVPVQTLLPAIQSLVSEDGRVAVLEDEDQIVVADLKEQVDVIEEAVLALDRPRPQVRIWALIYDCGLEDVERIGVNWNARFFGRGTRADGTPADQIALNTITAAAPAVGAPNGALTLMHLGSNAEVTAVVNALNTSSDSKLLADPNVVVANHEAAKIEIVTEIPYQQLTEGLEGGSIGTTAFREAGVTLEVTPHIARDDTISMLINPKFSVLAGFTENDEQPIIDRREAKTTVRVMNGETFVLGGLRQRTKIENRSGIPYLKDRKYIGKFFRFRSDTFRESELLVFITPQIVPVHSRNRPREEAASDFGYEELDCNRRAPDVCWPCTHEDGRKLGGPQRTTTFMSPGVMAAEGTPRENASQRDESVGKVGIAELGSGYDGSVASPDSNGAFRVAVRPAVSGQAAAESAAIRPTKLPLSERMQNVIKLRPQERRAVQGGADSLPEFGNPADPGIVPGLDLNSLLDILPMSGRAATGQPKVNQPTPQQNRGRIRLLPFFEGANRDVNVRSEQPPRASEPESGAVEFRVAPESQAGRRSFQNEDGHVGRVFIEDLSEISLSGPSASARR